MYLLSCLAARAPYQGAALGTGPLVGMQGAEFSSSLRPSLVMRL